MQEWACSGRSCGAILLCYASIPRRPLSSTHSRSSLFASLGHAFAVGVEPSQDLEIHRTVGVRRGLREEPVRFGKLEIGER